MDELISAFADNVAVCILAGSGLIVGACMLADLVIGALRKWEPIEVDRGEIVEVDR